MKAHYAENNEVMNKNIFSGRFKERKKSTFACGVILEIQNALEGILKICQLGLL